MVQDSEIVSSVFQHSTRCYYSWSEYFKFAERAIQSQPNRSDAEDWAKKFKDKYIRRIEELRINPWYKIH